MKKNYRNAVFSIFVAFLSLTAARGAFAEQYVVTAHIAPAFDNLKSVKNAPKEGWQKIPGDMEFAALVVYGDRVEGKPAPQKKGWVQLKDAQGEILGYIQASALTPMPKYEPMEARSYQVLKDKTVPYLLPGKRPLSDYDAFSLPRGAVVTATGKAQAEGKTWLLCLFGSDYLAAEASGAAGSDQRCGWIPEDATLDLAASSPELSKVEEDRLPQNLKGDARSAVLKNGFYVDPAPVFFDYLAEDDMTDAYNALPETTPRFIAADLPLHAFHLYFDRMLQKVEEKVLLPRTFELLTAMNEALKDLPQDLETSELGRGAASKVVDFLAVAMHLLTNGGSKLNSAQEFAAQALSGKGAGPNPFTGQPQDFSLFAPRGHYTLNDDFKTYFRATYLLGTPFSLEEPEGAAATALLCHILAVPAVQEKWRALYDPISYLVGSSNVNTHTDLSDALEGFRLGDLGDEGKVTELLAALDKAGKTSAVQKQPGKKFSILPRRLTFDAMLFDALTFEEVGSREKPRALPDPLDVMAALGSPAAQAEVKKYAGFANYEVKLEERTRAWPEFQASQDGDNVYTSWLSFFETYFRPTESQQFFAHSPAWDYKKLTTAEGSMTELKHDTILYAEQSGAEMGDGGDSWLAAPYALPLPRGYVEPEPKLFSALAECARKTLEFLTPMFPEEYEYYRDKLTGFTEQMDELSDLAQRAIKDEMTDEDFATIQGFRLQSVLPEDIGEVVTEEAQNQLKMALVADVATDVVDHDKALYMAVGTPRKIGVYVNDRSGGFRLAEGYMFSYYSFVKDLSDGRMNDDDWKAMVYNRKEQNELKKYLPDWHGKLNP